MSRLVLGLSFLLLFSLSIKAQDNKTSNANASAVRATVTDYNGGVFHR